MRARLSRPFVHALICGASFLLVAALYQLQRSGYFGRTLLHWEYRFRDLVTTHGRFNPPDERLVFLGIDSASVSISPLDLETLYRDLAPGSVEARAMEIMAAGWPWSRQIHGLLAERLLQAGARVVVFDLLFPKPGPGDEVLRAKVEASSGRIVMGSNFVPQVIGPGQTAWELTLPTETIIAEASPENRAIGFVNFWPDFDGVVRTVQYRATLDQMQGGPPPTTLTSDVPTALAGRAAQSIASERTESARAQLFRFSGPPGTFTPIPVYQTFVPRYWERNFAGGKSFEGKIVVVGPAGNWVHDEHATAFGQMPGPELQLNSINALLHGAFIREAPVWSGYLLMFLAAGTSCALAIFLTRIPLRVVTFVLLSATFLYAILLAYDHANTVVLGIAPLLTFAISGLGSFVYDYTRETLEKLRIRRTLESYVSADVVRDVLDNPVSYLNALGGSRVQVALLMTDLRGFTTLAEGMDSSQLVTQLNEYLSAMVEDVFQMRGSIDKFIGDAVLAIWGHLNSSGPAQDTKGAVDAFFRMRESLRRLNADWQKRRMPALAMGCGINFGEVVFGNIGSARKMEPTVVGDPVNVVARLEGLTKEYGREMLIGPNAAELVRDSYTLQFIDRVAVKGKTKPLDLHSVIGPIGEARDDATEKYLEVYQRALTAYRAADFRAAQSLFETCLTHRPSDSLAYIYLARCTELIAKPPVGEWRAIHIATHK